MGGLQRNVDTRKGPEHRGMASCSCAQGKAAEDEPQAVANQADCPKVGFEEIAIDLLQARFWPIK